MDSLLLAHRDTETWNPVLLGKGLFGKDRQVVVVEKIVEINLMAVKHFFDLKIIGVSNRVKAISFLLLMPRPLKHLPIV